MAGHWGFENIQLAAAAVAPEVAVEVVAILAVADVDADFAEVDVHAGAGGDAFAVLVDACDEVSSKICQILCSARQ